jgi:predicted Zn-dependent protease
MNSNSSLDEYDVRWTIRHEYGHVLGLPDCYIEFYDRTEKVIINYQIDTTNLMCSRKGHLQPIHVAELQKAYH